MQLLVKRTNDEIMRIRKERGLKRFPCGNERYEEKQTNKQTKIDENQNKIKGFELFSRSKTKKPTTQLNIPKNILKPFVEASVKSCCFFFLVLKKYFKRTSLIRCFVFI